MADIAIFRINYKSDFILTLNSDAGWMIPFCIKFWTGAPSQAYFVGFDGTTYTHCAPVDGEPTKLRVQFDDHHLPIGDLKFQIGYHFTVADFPTSVEDEVINQAFVIIEVDNAPAQVMLDFNGETAPEIEFSLPAYANEAQRIANEEQRIAHEAIRIVNEESRIAAETIRQQNEAQRIQHEEYRVSEFARLKRESEAATDDANAAATLANEKAALAADKAALADDAATLANAKAQLAADKAALAQAAATLANDKAALAQQKAEYAQTQGDYAKTQGDYAKDQGEIAEEDHERAETDHTRAESDHATAGSDHTQAGTDHTRAESDHATASADHTQAGQDHTRAESDHSRAESDHTTAAADHTQAGQDHTTAASDHTQAGSDHTRAESDHTRAESDHAAVELYVDSLGAFDISAYHATGGVLAKYADLTAALGTNGANIPDALRKGGMSVKFVLSSDNNYVQFRYMLQYAGNTTAENNKFVNPTNWQGVDIEPMAGSKNLVESGVLGEIVNQILRPSYTSIVGYINKNGVPNTTVTSFNRTSSISLKSGQRIVMHAAGTEQNVSMIAQCTTDQNVFIPLVVCVDSNLGYYYYTNTSGQDINVTLSYRTDKAFGFFITEIPYSDAVSYLANQINGLKAENVPHLKEVSIDINTFEYGTFNATTGKKIKYETFNGTLISKFYLKTSEVIKAIINAAGALYVAYYDENTNYLGNAYVSGASAVSPKEVVINDHYTAAKYILIGLSDIASSDYRPTVVFSKDATVENTAEIGSLKKGSVSVVTSDVTINTSSHQGYINVNGGISGLTQPYFYTDPMEFHKGDVIYLTSIDPSGANVVRLSRWNAEGTQCLKIIAYGTTTETTFVYVIEDEVEYLVFCGNNNLTFYPFNVVKETYSYSTTFKSAIEEIAKPLVPDVTYKRHYSYAMWKVLCIGDSLTSGAYYSGTWGGNSIDENYPRILGRMIGGDVANGGHSGASASDYYLNDLDNFTLSDYDTFIIWLGTNGGLTDTLDTDVNPYTDYNDFASTNTGCYCKIIEKIKEAKPDAFIVLTKIFAGPSNPGVPTTNQVIDKIATKYSLMVIDNSDLSYVKYPELHANVSNNPHFGKAGNIVVANRVVEKVSDYLYADPIKAEFGITARTN